MPGLNRLSIQSKMILLLLAVSLACIGVIAWIGYTSGKASLDKAIEQRLTALRSVKTTTIQKMLDSLREEVLAISDRPSTIDGMRALRDAYRGLATARLMPEQAAALQQFYADDFLPKLAAATGSEPVADAYLPALQDHARFQPAADDLRSPRIVEFSKGESIQQAGQRFRGFALVVEGKATLHSMDAAGRTTAVGEIGPGECFGDQLATGGGADEVGIVASDDLTAVVFDPAVIGELLQRSPGLSAELGDAVEARRQAARAAKAGR